MIKLKSNAMFVMGGTKFRPPGKQNSVPFMVKLNSVLF